MHNKLFTIKTFLCLFFAAAMTAACTMESEVKPDSSKEWDSLSFRVFIRDTNDYDLLDTGSKYYAGSQLTLLYKGKKYKINYPKPDSTKKFKYEELKLEKFDDSARYCIYFGPLPGATHYDDDFSINWKLKKAVANQPATNENIVHLRHIVFKDTAQTHWLFNGEDVKTDSTSVAFDILLIAK